MFDSISWFYFKPNGDSGPWTKTHLTFGFYEKTLCGVRIPGDAVDYGDRGVGTCVRCVKAADKARARKADTDAIKARLAAVKGG